MERKIGEIFEYNGEWYQCVVAMQGCRECSFRTRDYCARHSECMSLLRSDGRSVIFKKLEKVGKPYSCNYYGDDRLIMMQEYNLYNLDVATNGNKIPMYITDYKHKRIAIEFKNKEDMEEKKIKISKEDSDYLLDKLRYILDERVCGEGSDEVITDIKKLLDIDSEDIESNLKPFNLEAAKAGKPVCTRDGRKARIICFDLQSIEKTPIVAAIQVTDKQEVIANYYEDGQQFVDGISELDLMMLPEKKEGWVNVYKGGLLDTKSYNTKKEAFDKASPEDYVDTVKINWEE